MKKIFFIILVVVGLVFLYAVDENKMMQVKEKAAFAYAYMSFTGSFKTMPQKIAQFMGEFYKQGLKPSGMTLISVYHNSPEQVQESELKWDIGYAIEEDATVKLPLKRAIYKEKSVVEYVHKGKYELLPEVYQKLGAFIDGKGMIWQLPSYEFYLNNPMEVKPEELLTRIEIPVKKK